MDRRRTDNLTVTVSFQTTPYYASLLTALYELTHFLNTPAHNLVDCTLTSKELFATILSELSEVATGALPASSEADVSVVGGIGLQLNAAAQLELARRANQTSTNVYGQAIEHAG